MQNFAVICRINCFLNMYGHKDIVIDEEANVWNFIFVILREIKA